MQTPFSFTFWLQGLPRQPLIARQKRAGSGGAYDGVSDGSRVGAGDGEIRSRSRRRARTLEPEKPQRGCPYYRARAQVQMVNLTPQERSPCWSAQRNRKQKPRWQSGAPSRSQQLQDQGSNRCGRHDQEETRKRSCTGRLNWRGSACRRRRGLCLPRRGNEAQTPRASLARFQRAPQVPAVLWSEGSGAPAPSRAPSRHLGFFLHQCWDDGCGGRRRKASTDRSANTELAEGGAGGAN